jgi:hypothetical protein
MNANDLLGYFPTCFASLGNGLQNFDVLTRLHLQRQKTKIKVSSCFVGEKKKRGEQTNQCSISYNNFE